MIDRKFRGNKNPTRLRTEPAQSEDTPGLATVGSILHKARMEKGLSLEEVASATRVPKNHLDAIERGDSSALPPGPFTKGFVVSYAKHLGEHNQALMTLLERSDHAAPRSFEPQDGGDEVEEEVAASGGRRRQMRWALGAGIGATAAVLVGMVIGMQRSDEVLVDPGPEKLQILSEDAVQNGPKTTSERVVRAASIQGEDGQSYYVFTDLERGESPHKIKVSTKHRSYVRVSESPDGAPVFEKVLEAGKSESFTSEQELWLILGNAGAVKLTYNGEVVEALGEDGDRHAFAFRGP